jgi:predicted permease
MRLVNIEDVPFAFATMVLFWAMIALLHVVACSNVASLVLARAAARRRELGVRLCLGASRRNIVLHALAEPALLAIAGATGGVVIARWLTLLITRMQFMSAMDSGLDSRVLAIVALTAGATVLVFGLAPALEASRPDPLTTLRGLSSARAVGRGRDAGPLLVVLQVALSVILLANAAILTRTFERELTRDPGFDAAHLAVASIELRGTRSQWNDLDPSLDAMLARISALHGVRGAAIATGAPLVRAAGWFDELVIAGHHYTEDESRNVSMQVIGPGYFATIGAKLARGREFTARDRARGTDAAGWFDAVVVNEAMVRRFWPNEDPLGKQVAFRHRGAATVVGVVRDFHDLTLSAVPPRAYFPILEWRIWPKFEVMVQTTDDPAALAPVLRAAIASSTMPIQPPLVRSMPDLLSDSLELPRDGGIALGICASIALLLTSIGLYGLVSTLSEQRRKEIGIRLALGAHSMHIHKLMLGGVGRLVCIGALVGMCGAVAFVRIERGLWGPSIELEALPIVLSLALLGMIVAVAAYVPSRRATMRDPAEVLRTE